MKPLINGMGLLFVLASLVTAQDMSSQVTIQGSAIFTRKMTDSGITYKPTSSGGLVAGYRFNFNRWFGVEADYDYFRNTQKYLAPGGTNILAERTEVHAMTGSAAISIPNPLTRKLRSYVLAGGGLLWYRPTQAKLIESQTRQVIAFGGGMDLTITRHILLRAQARTFLYKAPDFQSGALQTDKFTRTVVPSFGLVFTF